MSTETTTETVIKPCSGCGVDVKQEMDRSNPYLVKLFGRMTTFLCAACAEVESAQREEEERRAEFEAKVKRRDYIAEYHCDFPVSRRVGFSQLNHPEDVVETCRRWAQGKLPGLLLVGEVGRGKTTLAGAAAWEMMLDRAVMWTSAPLLFARLGSGFQSEQREKALRTLDGKAALVLDDIDKARPTEFGAEQVFLAVDQRIEHRRPLLVTSNLDPDGIAEHWPEPYGTAIASRLVGYCRVVKVDGHDRRLV